MGRVSWADSVAREVWAKCRDVHRYVGRMRWVEDERHDGAKKWP